MFEDRIGSPTKILVFEANEEVLKCRLKERGNFDDKEESILKRIQLFAEKTKPVIDAYSKSLTKVMSNYQIKFSILVRINIRITKSSEDLNQ